MERVVFFNTDCPEIGLYTRRITKGEEYDLVRHFIDYYCSLFLKNNKKNNLAVFLEPRVTSGFPDVIFATYHPSIVDTWSDSRRTLGTNELKILSHLIHVNNSSGDKLITSLKLRERSTLRSLEKLMDANLVHYHNKHWEPAEPKFLFSVNKLVSIEAKINNISRVAEQSMLNTWFASHSYALINTANPQEDTLKSFSHSGIGLYCRPKSFRKVVEAKKLALPSSYQSLQFNEWIGNSLIKQ